MTTPNEELILKLRGQAYTTCRPDQLCDQAADLLQSLAERIKELEEEIGGWREDQKENIGVAFALQREVNKITSERDELREKYTDTYWALNDAARENTSLRAQLAAIAATEPVYYLGGGRLYGDKTSALFDNAKNAITELFTRPMPAQGVAELVEAFEYHIEQTRPIERSTIALSKYKGAK